MVLHQSLTCYWSLSWMGWKPTPLNLHWNIGKLGRCTNAYIRMYAHCNTQYHAADKFSTQWAMLIVAERKGGMWYKSAHTGKMPQQRYLRRHEVSFPGEDIIHTCISLALLIIFRLSWTLLLGVMIYLCDSYIINIDHSYELVWNHGYMKDLALSS